MVDISLTLGSDTNVQPDSEIELCFEVDAKEQKLDLCLAYLDPDERWECEDKCLKRKGKKLCGKTDHLTNFAILLLGNGDGCGDEDNFMLGDAKSDGILIACIVGAVWVILIVGALILQSGLFTRTFYGKEGYRIKKLRSGKSDEAILFAASN